MKKLLLMSLILFSLAGQSFASSYLNVEPEYLPANKTTSYKEVNETLAIIFSKIKPVIKTSKYPKYYHDFSEIKDDGTQNKAYRYVKNGNVELVYTRDTNELKFVSMRKPELQKSRILYDYPSGKLHAVQVFVSNSESYVYSPNGKYVDYSDYVKEVRETVVKNWKVPSRKQIEILSKGKNDLLVQIALTLNNDGSIKKYQVLNSSKIKELDENAISAVKSSKFKKFPENFFNEELVIILNFNFSL